MLPNSIFFSIKKPKTSFVFYYLICTIGEPRYKMDLFEIHITFKVAIMQLLFRKKNYGKYPTFQWLFFIAICSNISHRQIWLIFCVIKPWKLEYFKEVLYFGTLHQNPNWIISYRQNEDFILNKAIRDWGDAKAYGAIELMTH